MTAATRPRGERAAADSRPAFLDKYEMVVGLEVHVQLDTRTKAFCNCPTEFGAVPNANTCPVCLGLPGALPVLNAEAVRLAVHAAHALGCRVNRVSAFDRKNYFYPDLPKGYQITQYLKPIAEGGRLEIGRNVDGTPVTIGITRLHIEEDAGRSIHDRYAGATAIDLNRAGLPLIEIVSEPDMRKSVEAGAYLRILKQIVEYLAVSEAHMEEGSYRVDANISVRLKGETKLGTKTEVKNMNSFAAVERALEAEFTRQCTLVERGEKVVQQTMLWDEAKRVVRPSRSKEDSHDYRYFPDPDLPPLVLDPLWIDEQKEKLPELPAARRERFKGEYPDLTENDIDLLTSSVALADYYEHVARACGDPKTAANWVMGEVLASLNAVGAEVSDLRDLHAGYKVRPADLARLIGMVRDGIVSHPAAKRIFAIMVESGDRPEQIAEKQELVTEKADESYTAWLDEVIAESPKEWERYRAGETKLQGVLVGLVMKKSRGRADPKRVNQLLSERAGGG